jgi:mRNA-degrading endonuclease YafQ of YafQ-DinJ toxin-antitoxin module
VATPLREFEPRQQWPTAKAETTLRALTLLIPRTYNPDENGRRRKVELSKLVDTFQEIRQLTPGYTLHQLQGWYKDPGNEKWVRDQHFRVDIDLLVTPKIHLFLFQWKRVLEIRFEQQSMYMSLSKEIMWV